MLSKQTSKNQTFKKGVNSTGISGAEGSQWFAGFSHKVSSLVKQGMIYYSSSHIVQIMDYFRAQEPKAPVTYCDHPLSGVRRPSVCRPSSVRQFTFSTSSPEPLEWFWWNLVWWKYSMSLTSVVVFGQICPGADPGPDPGRGQNRSRGVPFLKKNFFFRLEGYSNKPNA